jgi:hypothetical protein
MRLAVLLLLTACDDTLDQRLAIIDAPRVIAIVSEPAEVKPGTLASYHAIVASPDGEVATPPRWAFCKAPKPVTEDNVVSDGCLQDSQLIALGEGATVTGKTPDDGCLRYGPDVPPGGFRPRDPDPTGGYYQPVRVDVVDLLAFGNTRITCKLPTAPADLARQYDLDYHANKNPTLDAIDLTSVPANSDITLVATWPEDAIETFLYFDAKAQSLVDRPEVMRVSWFATGGKLAVDATASETTTATTIWHTPDPGRMHLWFVLRDSRGGVAVQSADVDVR